MSGTSMDGVDASYLETDGVNQIQFGESCSLPYKEEFKKKMEDFKKIVIFISVQTQSAQ